MSWGLLSGWMSIRFPFLRVSLKNMHHSYPTDLADGTYPGWGEKTWAWDALSSLLGRISVSLGQIWVSYVASSVSLVRTMIEDARAGSPKPLWLYKSTNGVTEGRAGKVTLKSSGKTYPESSSPAEKRPNLITGRPDDSICRQRCMKLDMILLVQTWLDEWIYIKYDKR